MERRFSLVVIIIAWATKVQPLLETVHYFIVQCADNEVKPISMEEAQDAAFQKQKFCCELLGMLIVSPAHSKASPILRTIQFRPQHSKVECTRRSLVLAVLAVERESVH